MDGDREHLYKIGAISRMLGVSEHVLRFYEKKGLLTAKHKDRSPVRYYDEYDINILMQTRQLRGLGFTIDEVRDLLKSESDAADIEYYDLLAAKQAQVEDEAALLMRTARELDRLKDALRLNERSRDQVRTCVLPDLYWIYSMDERRTPQSLRQDEVLVRLIMERFNPGFRKIALVEPLPSPAPTTPVTSQPPAGPAEASQAALHYDWGIAITAEQMFLLPDRYRPCLTKIPGGSYLALGRREDHDCVLSQQTMRRLLGERASVGDCTMLVELLPGGYTNYLARR